MKIAQRINNPVLEDLGSVSGAEFFAKLIPLLLTGAFVVGIIAFMFYFLIGAIEWIRSGGDKSATAQARERITYAILGIFILLSLFAVVNLIEIFFGIDLTVFNLQDYRVGGGGATCGPGQQVCYDPVGNPFCWPAPGPCPG